MKRLGNSLSLRARITAMFVLTTAGVGIALISLVYGYLRLTPIPFRAEFPGEAVFDGAIPVADEVLQMVLVASLVSLAVLTCISGAVGWFVAGWVITPLSAIAQSAREFTAGELDTRTGYSGPDDEVGDLAAALDTMLDSLENSITAQRRFAANASHELKTPIATIQTIADVALDNQDQDPAELATTLTDALTNVRTINARNAETVDALLGLARSQAPAHERVHPRALCSEFVEYSEPEVVPESVITAVVIGDEVLLRQAMSNLVRNATIHGAAGTATMTLDIEDGQAIVTVSNSGEELTAEQVATFTEPFTRGRNRVTGQGHGLGLALTESIVRAHGGSLTLRPRTGGGLIAEISLPVAPASPPTPMSRPDRLVEGQGHPP